MNNEFVTYNIALRMKAIGFNEPCIAYATLEYSDVVHCGIGFKIHKESDLPTKPFGVPTWQSAFEWFRKNHDLDSYLMPARLETKKVYDYYIWFINEEGKKDLFIGMNNQYSYEVAELVCLVELIKIVEEKLGIVK